MIPRSSPRTLAAASAIALAVACATTPACADHHADHHTGHGTHTGAATPQTSLSEASKAYDAAMQKMHKGMSVPYSNDVDVDFIRGMIPHHQGAIDQAEVLLKYSKNLRLRRLAGGIIAAQRREIRFMEKWLKEREQGRESNDMPDWMRNAPSTAEDAAKSGARD